MDQLDLWYLDEVAEEISKLLPISDIESFFSMAGRYLLNGKDEKAIAFELSQMERISIAEARDIVENSKLPRLMENYPRHVHHYMPGNWAAELLIEEAESRMLKKAE